MGRVSRDTQALRNSHKVIHVPYRDSKLTRILQDSLGGNAKTCLIATINPLLVFEDESINTLRFADRAHQVMTHAKINEIKVTDHKEIHNLQSEIRRLKRLLQQHGINDSCDDSQDSVAPHKCDLVHFPSQRYTVRRSKKEDDLMVARKDQVQNFHQHRQTNVQQTNWHSHLDPLKINSKMQNNDTCEKLIEVISSVARLVEELLKSNSILPKTIGADNNDREYPMNIIGPTDVVRTEERSEYPAKDVVSRNMLTSLLAQRKKLKK